MEDPSYLCSVYVIHPQVKLCCTVLVRHQALLAVVSVQWRITFLKWIKRSASCSPFHLTTTSIKIGGVLVFSRVNQEQATPCGKICTTTTHTKAIMAGTTKALDLVSKSMETWRVRERPLLRFMSRKPELAKNKFW